MGRTATISMCARFAASNAGSLCQLVRKYCSKKGSFGSNRNSWMGEVFLTIGLRASPQAKSSVLRMDRSQIHGKPVLRTSHPQHPSLLALFVPFGREVPGLARIADGAARKLARVGERIGGERISALFKLNGLHLNVMCVTRGAKFLSGSLYGHTVSWDKLPSKLAELSCRASLRVAPRKA
jgi:hypothetical protein